MQRVGRACSVCRDGIHFEWSALGCAACGAAFHVACRAADDAGAAYRSRSAAACSRCGGVLEVARRPPCPDDVARERGGPRQAAFATAFVALAMLGAALSASVLLSGPVLFLGGTIALPGPSWIDAMRALACVVAGAGGLAASALVLRTPWTAMTFAPNESGSRARDPLGGARPR